MSIRSTIERNRVLKRIAAENRHLYARLINNCSSGNFPRQSSVSRGDLVSVAQSFYAPALHTRPLDEDGRWYESSFALQVHKRCRVAAGGARATSKEAAELGALTEALFIVPLHDEWQKIEVLFDSRLFTAFSRLLTCLDATATIQLSHKLPRLNLHSGRGSLSARQEQSSQYKATISLATKLFDESDIEPALHTGTPLSFTELPSTKVPDGKNLTPQNNDALPMQYDFGVSGEWTGSARQAVKSAINKSLKVLGECVEKEFRETGREAQVLLNELRLGGSTSSEMDTEYLNCILASKATLLSLNNVPGGDNENVLCQRSVRLKPTPHSSQSRIRTATQNRLSDRAVANHSSFCFAADAVELVSAAKMSSEMFHVKVVEHATFKLPASLLELMQGSNAILDANVALTSGYNRSLDAQSAVPQAALMCMAAEKRALYCGNGNLTEEALSKWVELQKGDLSSANAASRGTPFRRTMACLPSFAIHSKEEVKATLEVEEKTTKLLSTDSPLVSSFSKHAKQNVWHCPDVVVMLAMVRSILHLPHDSFPDVRFEQQALHDPARRVRELTSGLYGDVDVYTKVSLEWATPKGTFVACAVSDPALHSRGSLEQRATAQWLSCEDTGYQRGPLPLLIAAVCAVFDQVTEGRLLRPRRYPSVPVLSPFSRRGLDFLFYSWFGATPQVRCFAIATKAPSFASEINAPHSVQDVADGSTSCEVGASMTRAMLFYDLLGQRVLFAETHARSVTDAVARLNKLAMEVNHMQQDSWLFVSAASERPYRSIAPLLRWQKCREAFLRAAQHVPSSSSAVEKRAVVPAKETSVNTSRTDFGALLKQCVASCTSELSALWTVVELMAKASSAAPARDDAHDSTERTGTPAGEVAERVLAVRYIADHVFADSFTATSRSVEEAVDLSLWLGRRDVPWTVRPLGKEAMPPSSGWVELHLRSRCTGSSEETAGVCCANDASGIIFRCRVDPLSAINSSTNRNRNVASDENIYEEGDGKPGGVLPALTLLCRAALQHVWAECHTHHRALAAQLPSIEEVWRWCAAADPVLAREADKFPSYDAGFYSGPQLLGELLQGIHGKYTCVYAAIPAPPVKSATTGECIGGSTRPDTLSSPQPSTVFYRSEAFSIDVGGAEGDGGEVAEREGPWAAPRRRGEAQAALPAVACTISINGVLGCSAQTSGLSEDLTAAAVSTEVTRTEDGFCAGLVLGRGVGRTKREAWRSAAWQALRLQFPQVLAQLEVLRSVSEVSDHVDVVNGLCSTQPASVLDRAASNTIRGDSTLQTGKEDKAPLQQLSPSPVCGLRWSWQGPRSASRRKQHHSFSAAEPFGQGKTPDMTADTYTCHVHLVRADNLRVSLPAASASAATAGEAYVLAGQKLLQLFREVQHQQQQQQHAPIQTPGAPGFLRSTQRPFYYSTWRFTMHYTKSIWHAYAGALSAYFGEDMFVELIGEAPFTSGTAHHRANAAEATAWTTSLSSSSTSVLLRMDQLSVVQVRGSLEKSSEGNHTGPRSGRGPISNFARSFHRTDATAAELLSAESGRLIFHRSAASLLSRSLLPSTDQALPASHSNTPQPFALLRATSRWLWELVEQCAMPQRTREELHALLHSRLCDVQRTRRTARWRLARRVEVLARQWTGCRAQVHVRRWTSADAASISTTSSDLPLSTPLFSCRDGAWVAELHLQVYVAYQTGESSDRDDASVSVSESGAFRGKAAVERGMWVAGQATGVSRDKATWQLYCDLCAALRNAAPGCGQPEIEP